MDTEIEKLKKYFEKREDVVMAFLFGSRAKGEESFRENSDWDVAVYLSRENPEFERELWLDLEREIGAGVDLIVLNRVPTTLAWRILREGEELFIKERAFYLNFMLRVSEEADAFLKTSEEYYQVFLRSASLSRDDKKRLIDIATFLEEEFFEYAVLKSLTRQEYERDKIKKRNVEHWIEHLVNCAIDIAKIVLASNKKRLPGTYGEMVRALGSVDGFKSDLCDKLAGFVLLRNLIGHEYLEYRWREISDFLANSEPLFREFILALRNYFERSEK